MAQRLRIFCEEYSLLELFEKLFQLRNSFLVYFLVAWYSLLSSCVPFGHVRVFTDVKS